MHTAYITRQGQNQNLNAGDASPAHAGGATTFLSNFPNVLPTFHYGNFSQSQI